jgi:hypothetical protein
MTAVHRSISEQSPFCGGKQLRDGLAPWLKLVIGFFLILLFIFGVGRLCAHIPGADRMARVIDDYDLRATAIFYTDLDASAEGSEYIRHSLQYTH